jgi:hypothetical protein
VGVLHTTIDASSLTVKYVVGLGLPAVTTFGERSLNSSAMVASETLTHMLVAAYITSVTNCDNSQVVRLTS